MDVTLKSPVVAMFQVGGYFIARLDALDILRPWGDVALLTFDLDAKSGSPKDAWHHIRADGSCRTCNEWHGWLMDLAIEAGWECPALDAAVTARSGADR
jgi:hypothetical protein